MKSARDQDIATGIISLGLLANKLAWYLIGGTAGPPSLKVDDTIFGQWKNVLNETIDFIGAAKTKNERIQQSSVPHFLSRAQYLEQIYDATPDTSKRDLKDVATYLQTIYDSVDKLSNSQNLDSANKQRLLNFCRSVAKASIHEASKFHQESHIRRPSTMPIGIMTNA